MTQRGTSHALQVDRYRLPIRRLPICHPCLPRPAHPGALGCAPATDDPGTPAPPFELTDQRGGTFGSPQLTGRVWGGHLFSGACGEPCAAALDAQLRIQNELYNHPQVDDLWLVSLSVDPVGDTVSALAAFAEAEAKADAPARQRTGRGRSHR